jgi:hypothetical protein
LAGIDGIRISRRQTESVAQATTLAQKILEEKKSCERSLLSG